MFATVFGGEGEKKRRIAVASGDMASLLHKLIHSLAVVEQIVRADTYK
jgi:hypothetical protein